MWYGERERAREEELMQQNSQDPEGDATTVVHAVESLEQQLEDEQNSRPCSVALLGPNGAGKSFLINLLFQVTEVREDDYALNSSTNAGPAKDRSDETLRKHLFDTLEGSLELRSGVSCSRALEWVCPRRKSPSRLDRGKCITCSCGTSPRRK